MQGSDQGKGLLPPCQAQEGYGTPGLPVCNLLPDPWCVSECDSGEEEQGPEQSECLAGVPCRLSLGAPLTKGMMFTRLFVIIYSWKVGVKGALKSIVSHPRQQQY